MTTIKYGNKYTNCDRCGEELIVDSNIHNAETYKNAYLCLKCATKRRFDYNNPILYPINNN